MSEYGIYLSYNNQQEGFQIPINPGEIEISNGGKGEVYEISQLGEINVIKDPKLSEYAFEGIFPAHRYPFVTASILLEPQRYIDYLEKWMATKRPIRFVFVGKSFEINVPASIEDFQYREVAGSGGDVEYSLRLKKYVFYSAKKVTVTNRPGTNQPVIEKSTPARPNDRIPPRTYSLKSGDNLWKVAQLLLGSGARWKEIQTLNNIPDAELKRLPVGKVLQIPAA